MRAVLDANVVVSALISAKGAPAQIIAHWQAERFDVVVSPAILQELDRVLHYPKLQQRYHLREDHVQRFLRLLARQAIQVVPSQELTVIERDPADNRYLECALAGDAALIVTADQHLLDLAVYEGIQILTPAGFLALLGLEGYPETFRVSETLKVQFGEHQSVG
jgi:putative PIN family toxin of toxin-antitoxin system